MPDPKAGCKPAGPSTGLQHLPRTGRNTPSQEIDLLCVDLAMFIEPPVILIDKTLESHYNFSHHSVPGCGICIFLRMAVQIPRILLTPASPSQ